MGHTGELCKKRGDDQDTICGLTHVGPKNRVLDGSQDWMNPLAAARVDKTEMQPFFKMQPFNKLLWTLAIPRLSLHFPQVWRKVMAAYRRVDEL